MAAGGRTIAAPGLLGHGDPGGPLAMVAARRARVPRAARGGPAAPALPLGAPLRDAVRARPGLARRGWAGDRRGRGGAAVARPVAARRGRGGRDRRWRLWKNPRHG